MGRSPLLLAIDFSEASRKALLHCAELAEALGRPVVIVHAFSEVPRTRSLMASISERGDVPILRAQAELEVEEAEELSGRWAAYLRGKGIMVDTHAAEGRPAEVILSAIERFAPFAAVLGRRGLGQMERFLMGSVSTEVCQRSPAPVTVVPD